MKLRVFYNSDGVIQCVMHINRKAGTVPANALFSHLDVDMKKAGVSSLGEMHACFRVDDQGQLHRHSERRIVALQGRGVAAK
jgi:hypothetical protein